MIKIAKVYFYAIIILTIICIVPWFYHFMTDTPQYFPFTLYSPVTNTFTYMDNNDGKLAFKDENGKTYSESEFDSILPTFYYRQLMTDGRMPSQIAGRAVTPVSISRENFTFRHSTTDVNANNVKLYILLESESGRVDLKMPDDVFRIGKNIEFIDMKTNSVNKEKSMLYTETLKEAGCIFPIKAAFGNPSTRKEYDEGYFLIDAQNEVFHMKQVKGKPYIKNTGINGKCEPSHIFVTEFSARRSYAFICDNAGKMYVMKTPDYKLIQLPIDNFDVKKNDMMIIGDMFFWTVRKDTDSGVSYYAINADDYSLAGTLNRNFKTDIWDKIAKIVLPVELSFTSYNDKWVYPRFSF